MALRSSAGRPSFGYLSWACKKGDNKSGGDFIPGTESYPEESQKSRKTRPWPPGPGRFVMILLLADIPLPPNQGAVFRLR
jgi:hypothetical protein